jgi:type IV pilus assembly protein PilA
MKIQQLGKSKRKQEHGFTLSELAIAVAITGILSAIAIPNYVTQLRRSQQQSAKATISGIKTLIAGFTDETGELPTTWDQLNGIAAVMTSSGTAKGDLDTAITLPEGHYQVLVSGPTDAMYSISADRIDSNKKYDIKGCFNMSNGASSLNTGNGDTQAETPNCE